MLDKIDISNLRTILGEYNNNNLRNICITTHR